MWFYWAFTYLLTIIYFVSTILLCILWCKSKKINNILDDMSFAYIEHHLDEGDWILIIILGTCAVFIWPIMISFIIICVAINWSTTKLANFIDSIEIKKKDD
jgi:hypothetical protein